MFSFVCEKSKRKKVSEGEKKEDMGSLYVVVLYTHQAYFFSSLQFLTRRPFVVCPENNAKLLFHFF